MATLKQLHEIASVLRRDVLAMTTKAGSGHLTSCLSAAEILACLFFHEMKYDIKDAANPDNDEFILSKGHAAPLWYAALYHAGCIKEELLGFGTEESLLEGHPFPHLPWIKAAIGSPGQGLSIGLGMALAGKMQNRQFRTYVLLGDSESAEGQVYEAAQLAAHYKVNHLCAIIDINRLGQQTETMLAWNMKEYKKRWEGLGWSVISVNGHDNKQLSAAFAQARKATTPVVILAQTIKGKGISFLENQEGWHGRALNDAQATQAMLELPKARMPLLKISKPRKLSSKEQKRPPVPHTPYGITELVSTREAYGKALTRCVAENAKLLVLDAEHTISTSTELVKKTHPAQYIECYHAEQNMVSMALGLAIKGYTICATTPAVYTTKAHDQLRIAAWSKATMVLAGTHAGVSSGEDGQRGLEDISLFRALPHVAVVYPADAVATEKLLLRAVQNQSVTYIRLAKPKTPLLYAYTEEFPLGDFKVLEASVQDKAVIVGAGSTVHEAMKAHTALKKLRITTAVIDLYSLKPFNKEKFSAFVKEHGNKVVVVEDHYPEGGIGEMLAAALAHTESKLQLLAVSKIPRAASKERALEYAGINAQAILQAVHTMLESPPVTEPPQKAVSKKAKRKKKR